MREKGGRGIRTGQKKRFQAIGLNFSTTQQISKSSLTSYPTKLHPLISRMANKFSSHHAGTTVIGRGTTHCMQLCEHEEADTRILVHLEDALANGSTTSLVRTVHGY